MPFALVILGLIMIVTGAKDTHVQLASQLRKDFTGDNNFTYWMLAIGMVGSLGYVDALKTFSRYMLALIAIVLVLSHNGFFEQLMGAMKQGPISTGTGAGEGETLASGAPASIPTLQPAEQYDVGNNPLVDGFKSLGWLPPNTGKDAGSDPMENFKWTLSMVGKIFGGPSSSIVPASTPLY